MSEQQEKPFIDVRGLGNFARFVLLPGKRHDNIMAPGLIEGMDMRRYLPTMIDCVNGSAKRKPRPHLTYEPPGRRI